MATTPRTAIARTRFGDGDVSVELVDLATDDDVLGEIRAALPEGHGALIEDWHGGDEVAPRLFAALTDELRALGRRRATRIVRLPDATESAVLRAQGFTELRRDGESVTWILDL